MKKEENIYTPKAIEKILPEKLKFFRKQSGLTTAQVGALLNKTPSAVTLWETGKALPDVNTLLKLCNIYKVADLNDFLDTKINPDTKTLARNEQELITLWRRSPLPLRTAVKTILKQCSK